MSVYSLDNVECNVASLDEALVSWPEPGIRPVRTAEHLAPESELLAEADVVRGYDPVLLRSPVHMGRFCGRFFKSRMLQFVPGRFEQTVGVFFVRNRSGKPADPGYRRANNYFS